VAPAGRATRPTSDKVREAVFDVLQALPEIGAVAGEGVAAGRDRILSGGPSALAGQSVLDLYAGSGALGIEALSRGAARCTFVERDRAALAALRRNLSALGVAPGGDAAPAARVAASTVARALQADARAGCMYTLVLADPPYARSADALEVLSRLLEPVLAPQAVVVVETSVKEVVSLPWRTARVKVYGDTSVTFLVAD
jgi:16S rRNA (guanine966-N2)-methyltransferase